SYDQQVCDGMNRRIFLTESMKIKEYFFLMAQEDGEVKGYCLAVTSNMDNVNLIQPLYADNREIAELLLYNMCQLIGNNVSIFMQVWNCNENAMEIVKKMQLNFVVSQPVL